MTSVLIRAAALAAASTCLCSIGPGRALAQTGPQPEALPEIVVTAGREPQPIERTGSAISVVTRDDIRTTNPTSLTDALRTVPGLDVTETGGPGGTTSVRLRGANAGQTLVLVDGVRVNDPAQASGEFDFSLFAPGAIERIEVLRGPQSALYGSDAIGGVVNIITRRGEGPPRVDARVEAGRYGTLVTGGALSGSSGPFSYAFSATGQEFSGFSRYGYRIDRIERTRTTPLENDGFSRASGFGRIGYDAGDGVRFDISGLSTYVRAEIDETSGAFRDTPSVADRRFDQVQARASVDTFGGALTHTGTVFANRTDRRFDQFTYRLSGRTLTTTNMLSDFIGNRLGGEYQGNLRLGTFGSLVFGGRVENEAAETFSATGTSTRMLDPVLGTRRQTLDADQTTRSLFALWTLPLGERLTLSLGGRVDDVVDVDTFSTYRATAAYLIPETGTKLRASVGTGGKAPTLFQLFSPDNGNPNLVSEGSFGVDGGIDQTFLDGRVAVSLTGFDNRFTNLINFDSLTSRYFNTARAASSGLEAETRFVLWEDLLVLKSAYTYLNAKDVATNLTLARRPEHAARLALAITPDPLWLVEPRLTVVSERFSGNNETGRVAPYARLDVYAEHTVKERWAGVQFRVFARVENVTDVRYEEVRDFGTTGRAFYAGFNATW